MGREKHSGSHAAVTGSWTRRKKRVEGEHTAYKAPAFKPPVFKKKYNFNKKYIFIICAALAAVLVILCSVFLIHSNKKDYDTYITKAADFYGQEEYDNALTMLRKASDSASAEQKKECLMLMADCYEELGNLDKAIEALKKTESRDISVTRRIARLQQEKIELMESDKLRLAGEKFNRKERIIKLDDKGLKDEDIEQIGSFTCLERLSLADNDIENIGAVSGIKSLVSLNLNDNLIQDISPLAKLQGLKALYLDNNPIKALKPLLELKNLSFLSLRGINIQPQQLEKLSASLPNCSIYTDSGEDEDGFTISICGKSFSSEVKELDLSGMGLTNIAAVAECRNLEKLNISNNKISDLYAVMNLPQLSWLNASNNLIGDMRPLMGLKNLDTVLAAGNRVAATAAFGSMENLRVLDLSNNPIGDFSGFENMPKIQILGLTKTGLNDEGIKYLDELYSLQRLGIEDNPDLSGESVDELKGALRGCIINHSELHYSVAFGEIKVRSDAKDLDLSSCSLSNISPITNMTALVNVNLSSNSIENVYYLQYSLSKFSIKTLDLSSNSITDISPLAALTGLEELNLANNNISSAAKLINLKNLKTLNLSGNPLEKEDIENLKVNLGGCKIIFE